jgi:hypothetical protein
MKRLQEEYTVNGWKATLKNAPTAELQELFHRILELRQKPVTDSDRKHWKWSRDPTDRDQAQTMDRPSSVERNAQRLAAAARVAAPVRRRPRRVSESEMRPPPPPRRAPPARPLTKRDARKEVQARNRKKRWLERQDEYEEDENDGVQYVKTGSGRQRPRCSPVPDTISRSAVANGNDPPAGETVNETIAFGMGLFAAHRKPSGVSDRAHPPLTMLHIPPT